MRIVELPWNITYDKSITKGGMMDMGEKARGMTWYKKWLGKKCEMT